MFKNGELDDLEKIFKNMRDPQGHLASDNEKLFVCDAEPIYSPITVGEIRTLIAIARKYSRLTQL